jgi:hypothetical protein
MDNTLRYFIIDVFIERAENYYQMCRTYLVSLKAINGHKIQPRNTYFLASSNIIKLVEHLLKRY